MSFKLQPVYVLLTAASASLVIPLSDPLITNTAKLIASGDTSAQAYRDMSCNVDYERMGDDFDALDVYADTGDDTCTAVLMDGTTLTWEWSVAAKSREAQERRAVPASALPGPKAFI